MSYPRVPEVTFSLIGESWPITDYIQTTSSEVIELAHSFNGETEKEIAEQVLKYVCREVKYPVNFNGTMAAERSTRVFKFAGSIYHFEHETKYGWLFPNQTLRVKRGICYDTSVLTTSLLRIRGIQSYAAIGLILRRGKASGKHAWSIASLDGEPSLLETTLPRSVEIVPLDVAYGDQANIQYVELFGFDEQAYWENEEAVNVFEGDTSKGAEATGTARRWGRNEAANLIESIRLRFQQNRKARKA